MFTNRSLIKMTGLRYFNAKRTKVLLLKDHPRLGFAGEYVFVKPHYALSSLVRYKYGMITTDPRYKMITKETNDDGAEILKVNVPPGPIKRGKFVKLSKDHDKLVPTKEVIIDLKELEEKQKQRLYRIYIEKLMSIVLVYVRPTSLINENITLKPVTKEEVKSDLLKTHGIQIEDEDLLMANNLEQTGDHFINTKFYSSYFEKDFTFTFIARIKSSSI